MNNPADILDILNNKQLHFSRKGNVYDVFYIYNGPKKIAFRASNILTPFGIENYKNKLCVNIEFTDYKNNNMYNELQDVLMDRL